MTISRAPSPSYKIVQETSKVIKNITLEGVTTLKAEKVTTTYEVKREYFPDTNRSPKIISKVPIYESSEPMSFDLVEVTREELAVYRRSKIPSFVLKVYGKLYYCRIPNNISFVFSNILGEHKCAYAGKECDRLSPASDADGGCSKVRHRSRYIEMYPWIVTGYETFSTHHDSFVVVDCLHYEKAQPSKKLPPKEFNRVQLSLAQFVWDDVSTQSELNDRLKGK